MSKPKSITDRLGAVGTGAGGGVILSALIAPYWPNAPETITAEMWVFGYNMALVAAILGAGSQIALWIVGKYAERKERAREQPPSHPSS